MSQLEPPGRAHAARAGCHLISSTPDATASVLEEQSRYQTPSILYNVCTCVFSPAPYCPELAVQYCTYQTRPACMYYVCIVMAMSARQSLGPPSLLLPFFSPDPCRRPSLEAIFLFHLQTLEPASSRPRRPASSLHMCNVGNVLTPPCLALPCLPCPVCPVRSCPVLLDASSDHD